MSTDFQNIIAKAQAGDQMAFELIIDAFIPLINKHSVVNGKLDEDCRQYILLRIYLAINQFDISKIKIS